MRVALYTNVMTEASFTHGRIPPDSFQWLPHSERDVDLALATGDAAEWLLSERPKNGVPRVLWLQEANWITRDWGLVPKGFDLILSNNKSFVAAGAAYMTLWGSWIDCPVVGEKTENVSMVASAKFLPDVAGYMTRHEVLHFLPDEWKRRHGYGRLFSRYIEDKTPAYANYRFSIAVENERYDWWHTEKLFDCFAAKCVPIYWGCGDPQKLIEAGFDPAGIIHAETSGQIGSAKEEVCDELYQAMLPSIEQNYERVRELYCVETVLEPLLKERFNL